MQEKLKNFNVRLACGLKIEEKSIQLEFLKKRYKMYGLKPFKTDAGLWVGFSHDTNRT